MMLFLLLAAQPMPVEGSEPSRVALSACEGRLSEVLDRFGSSTGRPVTVTGLWNPRVSFPALEGPFWELLDRVASDVGGTVGQEHVGGSRGGEQPVLRQSAASERPIAVAYAGPWRIAVQQILESRRREPTSAGAGAEITFVVQAEPGRAPLGFAWDVESLSAGDRAMDAITKVPGCPSFRVQFRPPDPPPAGLTLVLRLRGEFPAAVARTRVTERSLRAGEEIRLGGRPVSAQLTMEEAWIGRFQMDGVERPGFVGVALPGDSDRLSGVSIRTFWDGRESPAWGASVSWGDVAPPERELILWWIESTETREWTVRFDDLPYPARGP